MATKNKKEDKKEVKKETTVAEAEIKTGIKESVINDDAVKLADDSEPEEVVFPSFFIEEDDKIVIDVDILFDKKNGRLTSVSRAGILNSDDYDTFGNCIESFTFKPVDYDQITKYRQRCTTYRRDAGKSLVDPIQLRNYLIVWHLKDWTIRDNKGKKIELTFSDAGGLEDDSIEKVYKINPTMLDVVLTLFEKDMMM